MSRLLPALLASVLLASTPIRADAAYNRLVDGLRRHYHHGPTAGEGFTGLLIRCFAPSGVGGLRTAVFEGLGPAPGEAFDAEVQGAVSPAYHPFVRTRTDRGERTWVWMREDGSHVLVLVLTLEPDEAVVAQMRLDPEAFAHWLDDPGRKGPHRTR